MRRQVATALLVFAVVGLTVGTASAQDDAEVRKELEAQYLKLAQAHDRKDLKTIIGLKTADFHAILPDGRVSDSKSMEENSRQFLAK